MDKKVLWLITARSGSKSVPDKNIKILGEHPLLAYRVKCALKSAYPSDVWISTDSDKYAKIAEVYGATVPFLRPAALSSDEASSMDVVLHAMDFAENLGKSYEYIGLLEPTSPFIFSNTLDDAISKLAGHQDASSIVAVKESRPNRIFIQEESQFLTDLALNLNKIKKMGRQAFGKEITPSGGFYISKWSDFLTNKTFYTSGTLSYEVDDIAGIEIDEQIDWQFASFLIEKNIFDIEKIFK